MASILRTLRFGFRVFLYQPMFAACIVSTAAVGLATNAALFAIVDGAFLRELPFPQADRLIHLELKSLDFIQLAKLDRRRLSELQQRLLESSSSSPLASFKVDEIIQDAVELSEEWRSLQVREVSHNFFDVLAVQPRVGRTFTEDDSRRMPRPVVLSHALWRRQFGADEKIVGTLVQLPGTASRGFSEVIGVMPEGFGFPHGVHLWVVGPRPMAPVGVSFIARLTPGGSLAGLRAQFPEMTAISLEEFSRPPNSKMIAYLLTGSICLFLVAWLQVGSLLLSRTLRRMPEFRLKVALGATPRRLRLECLGEVLLLMSVAVLVACALAPLFNVAVLRQIPDSVMVGRSLAIGWRSVIFLLLLGLLGVSTVSIIPMAVLRASHDDPFTGREGLARPIKTMRRFRQVVFVTQVGIATVLVYLTTIVALSYRSVSTVPLGFDPRGLWAVTLPIFEAPRTSDRAAARSLLDAHRTRVDETIRLLASQREIVSMATTSFLPMQGAGLDPALFRVERDPERRAFAGRQGYVSGGFTNVLQIPVSAGRDILPSEADAIAEPSPQQPGISFGLANTALEKQLAQFGDAVGQVVVHEPLRRVTIVGVIPDVRLERPDEPSIPTLLMFTKGLTGGQRLLIRVDDESVPRQSVSNALRSTWGPDRTSEVHSVENWVRIATAEYRARVVVLTFMVLFSIPVAAVGLLGAVTHECAARRYEFAVRAALGSTPVALRNLLLKQFAVLAAIGLGAGAATAGAIVKAMSALLFGVGATDPRAALFVVGVMTLIVGIAVLLPSRAVIAQELGAALKEY